MATLAAPCHQLPLALNCTLTTITTMATNAAHLAARLAHVRYPPAG